MQVKVLLEGRPFGTAGGFILREVAGTPNRERIAAGGSAGDRLAQEIAHFDPD